MHLIYKPYTWMIFKTLPRDILRLGAIIERQSAETTPWGGGGPSGSKEYN